MPINMNDLEALVKSAFPGADIEISDLAGDNDHYSMTIASTQFNGVPRVKQHKMVYDALQGKMGGELHALQLKTIAKP